MEVWCTNQKTKLKAKEIYTNLCISACYSEIMLQFLVNDFGSRKQSLKSECSDFLYLQEGCGPQYHTL